MDEQLVLLKQKLHSENLTCVVQNGAEFLTSTERGIKPLLIFIQDNPGCISGAAAADKVIGKAAALLFVYGGISRIYAEVISNPALEVFKRYGVECSYGTLVERIRNRAGDGLCPMETRAMDITSPEDAYETFRNLIQ